jgi:hypothetical protein
MDELVGRIEIVDAALVKAVTVLMPGASIEAILDAARAVTLKRVFNAIKSQTFTTVIHMVDEIKLSGLSEEDSKIVLTWIGEECPEAKALVESGLVGSVFKFISDLGEAPNNQAAWCCTRPKVR